jgi:hypothetical protein
MAIRRFWPVLAAALGIGIGILIWRAPGGPTIMRFLPVVGVGVLAVLCFRDWFRQDRIAFVSVVGPAFVVALASTFTNPPWWSLTGVIPLVFLALFIFDTPVRGWWWRHVLRRRPPTAGQTSDYRLSVGLKAWSDALRGPGTELWRQVDASERAIQQLRDVELPEADFSILRDSYVDVAERWSALARIGPEADGWASIQDELAALDARHRALREPS